MNSKYDSPTWKAASKMKAVSKGFSRFHAQLLDICFDKSCRPDPERVQALEGPTLSTDDLNSLAYMILVEFTASLEKELKGSHEESQVKTLPKPYDVFLMKTTMGGLHAKNTMGGQLAKNTAVCMPMKGGKLEWWDGGNNFQSLASCDRLYRIASLSGSARVLQCLHHIRICLKDDSLSWWAMKRERLINVLEKYDARVDPSIVESLNESQRKAVATVASTKFQDGFFAVQGPPGCGKTTTMVGMISAIGEDVIVTAPSNAAVANLALKLYGTGRFRFGDMCVFGDGCDTSVEFLNPRHRSTKYKKALEEYEGLMSMGSKSAAEKMCHERAAEKIRQTLAEWLRVYPKLTFPELGNLCPDVEVDHKTDSLTSNGMRDVSKIMGDAKVILCTLNSSGSYMLRSAVSRSCFHTLMLDEGGQCTQAEFFIATSFPGIRRIIVMGDPKQLRPTVIDRDCKGAGFGESWLGQVYELHRSKVHLLDTQYRMDPLILHFPNNRFYGKRIQSGDNVLHREPPINQPFSFIDTQRRGREEKDESLSFKNSYEVAVINNMLNNDSDITTLLEANARARIIIITPYKAQMKLLKDGIRLSGPSKVEVSTVDAFQGQEADIVVLSTVRTKFVGFVDDAQRLNVALTRAKRILRVVGDIHFFQSLPQCSTLRALARYALQSNNKKVTKLRSIPNCPPDLSIQTLWITTMTQRFNNALRVKPLRDIHVAMNTLSALATPDINALSSHVTEKQGWHTSWLKGYKETRIIWVARDRDGRGVIEAHYVGSNRDCLGFVQRNHVPPDGCCAPTSDMSGMVSTGLQSSPPENGQIFVSWLLNNKIQNAIISKKIEALPLSMIQLDPPQERIARSPPPLLIESRSGTGKTLVLLQHAAFYLRTADTRPACFITVSPRLKNELEEKYEELITIQGTGLPRTRFFTFQDFVNGLLSHHHILDFDNRDKCIFQGYLMARQCHDKLRIEAHLIENEIGGVITGSLVAALQGAVLSRDQYLDDKRSNVSNKTTGGRQNRNLIYDEYERYRKWKVATGKFDIHEVVLRLVREGTNQLFSSAYLDEVQDLSHAAVYLICNLAGKHTHHWVCGGDPAQMISPGCSFTFDGLKQTLLAVENGIENKLKQVQHLVVNYRTTKDILLFGNEILATAKKHFPGAIEFAHPERARKDLGLKVVLCDWKIAFEAKVKFGDNQAFIYSRGDSDSLTREANKWLDNHPFVLSSLDSKGLEFDDVVVAFDLDRKVWQVDRQREASLAMLRELYVAVTRAQRRVVILVKNKLPAMRQFLASLNCNLEDVDERILQEFDCDTSAEKWFLRAQKLLNNGQFNLAAGCFTRAGRQDWSFLALGHYLLESGLGVKAAMEFRRSARLFYESHDFQQILNILLLLLDTHPWHGSDDKIFLEALGEVPAYIPRAEVVKFAIRRGAFSTIALADLKSDDVSRYLIGYREEEWLKNLIAGCSDSDRAAVESSMPLAVVDYYFTNGDFFHACRVSLCAADYHYANNATKGWLKVIKLNFNKATVLGMVDLWKQQEKEALYQSLPRTSPALFLRELFDSPMAVPHSLRSDSVRCLGKHIVILALDQSNLDRACLIDFDKEQFKHEVNSLLMSRFEPYLIGVFNWYSTNGHASLASEFAKGRLQDWSGDDMLRIVFDLWARPKWLFQELAIRNLLDVSIFLVLLSPHSGGESKKKFKEDYKCFDRNGTPEDLDLGTIMAAMSKRKQFIEKTLLHVYMDCNNEMIVQSSMEALGSHELATSNIVNILRLWGDQAQGKHAWWNLFKATTPKELRCFLMSMFFLHVPEENHRDIYNLEEESFLLAFGPTVMAYSRILPDAHHAEKVRKQLADFHKQLRGRLQQQFKELHGSATVRTTVESDTTDKPLSKKAQRKQRQNAKQTNRQVTHDKMHQASSSQTTGGQNKKKRTNKKKKGGRR